mmetsp:Transcript_20110/g.53680  ORF Transcript_20110/g.53680 Transcript_20110/m.53680 type:complete len:172 (-) Transcript_20110:153-668(-)
MQQWNRMLCEPSISCFLTCLGCGCIPVSKIIVRASPIDLCDTGIHMNADSAVIWALIFYLGTVYCVGQGTIIFSLLFVIFVVSAKNRLDVDEDDLLTAFKGLCCAPCVVGQLEGNASERPVQSSARALIVAPVPVTTRGGPPENLVPIAGEALLQPSPEQAVMGASDVSPV